MGEGQDTAISLKIYSFPYCFEQNPQLSASQPAKTLLLNFHAIIRFQRIQLFGLTGRGIYSAWWVYILTMVDLYVHRAGSIYPPSGVYRSISRVKVGGTWAGQNRASVESNYSKKKGKLYTFAFRGAFSPKHR